MRNPKELEDFWNREAESFDAIYSGAKPRWARLLDRWLRRDVQQRLDWILQQAGDLQGKSVCDLGCGSGRYLVACARGGARRALGVDLAPKMLELASELVARFGVSDRCELRRVNIVESRIEELFDITLAVGVLDYLHDPLSFLRSVRALTTSRFLATFPRRWSWRMPLRKLRLALRGCPVYFYSAGEVRALLHQAGFRCQRLEPVGALFCVLALPDGKLVETPAEGGAAHDG